MPVLLLGFAPDKIDPAVLDKIQALAPDLQVVVTRDRAEMAALSDELEIVVGDVPHSVIMGAPRLRWFQQWGAGADWLLHYPEAVEREFVVTTASGVHAIPISEQIIGMLLMFARGLHRAVRAQTNHTWQHQPAEQLFETAGKTMLLVGVGAIGERTAQLAGALGMEVEGIRRNPDQAVAGVKAMYGPDQLRARLPHADVVVLTIPLSTATQGLFGATELKAMKPTAYLINIGRGGTIDEAALVQALSEHWIAGAGLDVFTQEPLPATSPLWAMEQVIMTAHYAGATPQYEERLMAIFLDNLERYRAGTPLHNLVDKRAGY